MLAVINASSRKYQNKTDRQRALNGQMNQQSLTTSDYYEALKIMITIPLLEKYQDDNLPKDSLYRQIIHEQKDLIGKIKKKVENPGFKKLEFVNPYDSIHFQMLSKEFEPGNHKL